MWFVIFRTGFDEIHPMVATLMWYVYPIIWFNIQWFRTDVNHCRLLRCKLAIFQRNWFPRLSSPSRRKYYMCTFGGCVNKTANSSVWLQLPAERLNPHNCVHRAIDWSKVAFRAAAPGRTFPPVWLRFGRMSHEQTRAEKTCDYGAFVSVCMCVGSNVISIWQSVNSGIIIFCFVCAYVYYT